MLDYNLEQRGEASLYEYVYQQIRDDIVAGRIASGEHLPSKRAFASHLGISVITIENAYSQLVAEGYICSKPRRGYYACELPDAPVLASAETELDRDSAAAGSNAHDAGEQPEQFAPLSPSALEAARLWQSALRATLTSEDEREIFSPAPAQGTARLRLAIAHHLRGTRGMNVNPDNIVIGAGAQLLDTMLVQLLGADKIYAVEDPGYLRLTRIYQAMGCKVRHIPLDGEGVNLGELLDAGADVLHLMPSHQYPTGLVTSIARRYALLSWAAERPGRYLIEDDFDCEFRLAGKPIPALASIDAAQSVIYTNTFSKSLSSALRLAYMVLPDELMERFRRELGFYASSVSSVDQVALARLLESGDYERHVNRVRVRAREARDGLVALVRKAFPAGEVSIEHADAGLYCVLAPASDKVGDGLIRAITDVGIPYVNIDDCLWANDRTTIQRTTRRVLVQYDDLSPQTLDALQNQLQ
ncbi:PLP-dependent aminotransferase family protein [Collinsella aerofaciens]|uniref:MocR-like pyridoxine biosynthesis transcription factor PdxR n=1 Tax=Collinsella aerofaciens TaxID=74426 RepID=UPI00189EFDF7|nr:PLP-dependent aminotransferase family protein [Collinsella aerofaciens]MDB1885586.1 PLP-dependent aminotransferase family protein [Collinsella aerofaciens]MDB1889330.1 PLP-dependent aminotransferase family protein [Collinsella aerofaciens]MDB1891310.1 PLP-dependent aminotransferase family protein [Collinsella aerofaciens]MDB1893317.1 PLP-dependent aminotransferase family protein [Collinsella aerofaciens]